MPRRISTILHRLRQDLAQPLGTDFLLAACLAAGHTWSDAALLTQPPSSTGSSSRSSTATPR